MYKVEQKKVPFFRKLKNAITNFDEYQKFSKETLGTTIKYFLSEKISLKVVSIAIIPCLLASYIGSKLVMYIPDYVIKWAILIAIPIALFFLLKIFFHHCRNNR